MSSTALPLSPGRAVAFHEAFEDRAVHIAEQPGQVRHRIGYEATIPLPGCPHCWRDAEAVQWHLFEDELLTIVDPCGHSFRTEAPIVVHRSGPGWITEEEWRP